MHEDLIGRLTFALEKQKAGAFSYLFSEAIAALSAQPDAGSGGDARAQVADGMLPPLPIAFFDEFGRGADDRVQDYARAAILATHPQPAADIDAARYRYLRAQPVEGGPWGTPRIAIPRSERAGQFANEEDADAAIDEAMAALNASLAKPAAAQQHFQDRLAEIEGRPRAEPEPPHDACACCYSNDCNGECMENL